MSVLIVPSAKYPTIQSAVDASEAGDLISIFPGEYKESVIVLQDNITIEGASFGVTLQGQDKTGVGLVIVSKGVKLKQLVIQNYQLGILIEGSSVDVTFCYCLANGDFGIQLSGDDCNITSCGCDGNGLFGMDIGGNNNRIYDNRCLNNTLGGISNSNSILTNSLIEKNILVDPAIGLTFTLANSHSNCVLSNSITAGTGIFIEAGQTMIRRNILQNCTTNGLQINSSDNVVYDNQITGSRNAIQVGQNHNKIKRNILDTSSESGIVLLSDDNSVTCNIITSATIGIKSSGKGNIIKCNKFFNNDLDVLNV